MHGHNGWKAVIIPIPLRPKQIFICITISPLYQNGFFTMDRETHSDFDLTIDDY